MIRLFKLSMVDNQAAGTATGVADVPVALSNSCAQSSVPSKRVRKQGVSTTPISVVCTAVFLGILFAPLGAVASIESFISRVSSPARTRAEFGKRKATEGITAPFTLFAAPYGVPIFKGRICGSKIVWMSDSSAAWCDDVNVDPTPYVVARPTAKVVLKNGGWSTFRYRFRTRIAQNRNHAGYYQKSEIQS